MKIKKYLLLFIALILFGCTVNKSNLTNIFDDNRNNLTLFINTQSIADAPYKQEFSLIITEDDLVKYHINNLNNDAQAYIEDYNNSVNDMLNYISNEIRNLDLKEINKSNIDESKLAYIFNNDGVMLYLYSDNKIKVIKNDNKSYYSHSDEELVSIVDNGINGLIEMQKEFNRNN